MAGKLKAPKIKIEVDSLILGCASLVLATVVFFLFSDGALLNEENRSELTPVGRFSQSQNDVRRRVEAGLTWTPINTTNEAVFEGDSVFTGEGSQASVRLDNGGQLTIDPNSLVVIRTHNKAVEIDLQYGQLVGKVESDKPILIKQQNGQYKALEASSAEVRITQSEKSKDTQIQVVKGEVRIRPQKKPVEKKAEKEPSLQSRFTNFFKEESKEEKIAAEKSKNKDDESNKTDSSSSTLASDEAEAPVQVLKQNEVAQLTPEAPPAPKVEENKPVEVRLVSPSEDRKLWVPPGLGVRFQWDASNRSGGEALRFEIASDENFTDIVLSQDIKGESFSLSSAQRPNGVFYWRVRPTSDRQKKGLLSSTARQLTLHADVPPSLPASAVEEEKYDLQMGETGKSVNLKWEDSSDSTEFKVEVARDANFESIVGKKRVVTSSLQTSPLPPGKYFWHVMGTHPDRASAPWSKTAFFEIKEAPKPLLAPVVKNIDGGSPSRPSRMPTAVLPADGAVKPENLPPFTWEPIANADSYEVEISEHVDFQGKTQLYDAGSRTSFALPEVKPGSIFFRVRGKAKDGRVSPPSKPTQLDVQLPAPKLNPTASEITKFRTEEELQKGTHEFKFSWSPRPLASGYEVEWGIDPQFSRSKKIEVKKPVYDLAVSKPREYSVRVRALSSTGAPVSPYSETQTVAYQKELLPPPPPTPPPTPTPEPAIVANSDVRVPMGESAVVMSGVTNVAVSPAFSSLPPEARPRSFREKKEMKKQALSPEKLADLSVPLLREPASDTSVLSIAEAPVYVQFKWRKVANAGSYTIQVATDPGFEKRVFETNVKTDNYFFKQKLPKGRVYWRVRANAGPTPSEWSDPFDLNVHYE